MGYVRMASPCKVTINTVPLIDNSGVSALRTSTKTSSDLYWSCSRS